MGGENPLAALGDLSKPATVFIEKISDAIGGVFKPNQIIRVAKAEAEAERIRAESRIQITDIQRRAFHRFLEEEAKKQKNIESITKQAIPQLEDQSQPNKMEDDWITNFFDQCRLISDEQMQGLWSRVLAGEANLPGTYSKRTVNFLSSLDKNDAKLFTDLCGFGWRINNLVPLIYDEQDEIYNSKGINFNSLSHLESIGLIQYDPIAGFERLKLAKKVSTSYYGTPVVLILPKDSDNSLEIGRVLLTKVGQELAPICGGQAVSGFLDFIREKWKKLKFIPDEAVVNQMPLSGEK